jgi:hypothetical protein
MLGLTVRELGFNPLTGKFEFEEELQTKKQEE